MNPFTKITFSPNYVTGHGIQWGIDYGFNDPKPYDFTIELAETPLFSELIWSKNVGEHYMAIDDSQTRTIAESHYYRVKLVTGKGTYYSPTLLFGSTKTTRLKYTQAAEIQRKELLRMRVGPGHVAYLLKRKTYGKQAELTDPITGEPIADSPTDFGTGIEGGYHTPIKIMFSREGDKHAKSFDQQGMGITASTTLTFRMIGFPLVSPKDLLYDPSDGSFYSIETFDHTMFPGTDIHLIQRGTMLLLPPSDSIYQMYPLPGEEPF